MGGADWPGSEGRLVKRDAACVRCEEERNDKNMKCLLLADGLLTPAGKNKQEVEKSSESGDKMIF